MGNGISLALDVLLLDPGIQPRTGLVTQVVEEYARLYAEGHPLPPIVVFQDGPDYLVADGFHRVTAARQAGMQELTAEVHPGTKREAILYACGANKHGLPRTNEDKRRAVLRLLEDPAWGQWSDSAIARHCGVSLPTVSKYRKELSLKFLEIAEAAPSGLPQRRVRRGEQTYTMNTARLGRRDNVPGVSPPAPVLQLTPDSPSVEGKRPTFNRVNENIDWAKWSWNPVTGCLHNCVYCYARDIAERFYPEKFAPTFRPERLGAPHATKLPAKAETDIGERNVFVCSMADLFGKWVPQAWIDAVLTAVCAAPQWNFLFLTKFPQRLADIDWPENAWVGTTVDEQYRVDIAEKAFRRVNAPVKWLSCEPLRERLTFSSLDMFDWVVIGGQSKSTHAPAFQPPWEWVEHLMTQARAAGCMVYWKANLLVRPQEYPQQAPIGRER